MSLVEKIKQKAVVLYDTFGTGMKTIPLNDVLKILREEELKLQELADLLKNRPKMENVVALNVWKMDDAGLDILFRQKMEEWCEGFEKKFAESFDVETKKESKRK